MAKASTKIDDAWQKVSDRTGLLQKIKEAGCCFITAKELQRFSDEHQARLMAKMDFDHQRPRLFKDNKLNILPLKRGDYVVFEDPDNVCYYDLPNFYEKGQPTAFSPKKDLRALDTLQKQVCSTEQDALRLAFLSSLLQTFCTTEELFETKSGRFGSNKFELKLPGCGKLIEVDQSQIEVDQIYESNDAVVLVEAKIGFHKDFHVRQLFYPFCWIRQQTKKRIVPILLCYSNGEFQLTEFAIGEQFHNIQHIRQDYFVIDEYVVARGDLSVLTKLVGTAEEDLSVPFPQADDMDKVVDVVRLAQRGITDPDRLVEMFGFVRRQASYYRDAARYLGLIDARGKLTKYGGRLLSERYRVNRTEMILKRLLMRPAIREAMLLLESRKFDAESIAVKDLAAIIDRHRPGEFTQNTLERRAYTIRNWLRWLVANCDFGLAIK